MELKDRLQEDAIKEFGGDSDEENGDYEGPF